MLRTLPFLVLPVFIFAACGSDAEAPPSPPRDQEGVFSLDAGRSAVKDAAKDATTDAPPVDAAPRARCDLQEGETFSLAPGHWYGEHVLVAASSLGAPPGTYTFQDCKQNGNWAQVDLVHDGTRIRTFDIPTYEIMGECGPDAVKIGFPGYFAFEMASRFGSRNLYGICETVFDGRHAYVVP